MSAERRQPKQKRYVYAVDVNASDEESSDALARRTDSRPLLAANVRRLRLEKGWSQEDLGEEAELHRTFVGIVERGETNISLRNMDRLARALGVETFELLQPR